LFLENSCKRTDLTPAYIHVTLEDLENCIDVSNFNETHDQFFDQDELDAISRHKFTHVNVYVNNKNLGCWQLPCKVPVLDVSSTDTSTVVLLPAFPLSGMSNTITGYPFLNICRQKVVLQKGVTYEVAQNLPKYVYSEYACFPFFETFSNSTSFSPSSVSATAQGFDLVEVDGNKVGEIVLNDEDGLSFEVLSSSFYAPVGSYRTLLEIRYKTEVDIQVAAKMATAYYPNNAYAVGGIYKSPDEWKTIHFDLTNIINGNHSTTGNVTAMTLVLSGVANPGEVKRVDIDDVKVVYIKTA
jgi:hypothetical protein